MVGTFYDVQRIILTCLFPDDGYAERDLIL